MLIPGRLWRHTSRRIGRSSVVSRLSSTMASPKLKRPIRLVLDFDGTLTVKDTMNVLGQLPKVPQTTWSEISESYMKDYADYNNEKFEWSQYNRIEYSRWLSARRWVEVRSAQRVQDAGFFKGVTAEEMHHAVSVALQHGDLRLRDNWAELVNLGINGPNSDVSIISVNWSETFIRTVLLQAAENLGDDQLTHYLKKMKIHANEIDGLSSPGGSSGRVCRVNSEDIRTSDDKVKYLPQADKEVANQLVIYVGDSPTDFDCLCAADLGVWLHDTSETEYSAVFKEVFAPLTSVPPAVRSFGETTAAGVPFYWARNFADIIEVISAKDGN